MRRRSCATCKYYERSSIPRMGWCRHPELYAPHHSHLVSADDLDCDRGLGDYWQPAADRSEIHLTSQAATGGDQPPIMARTSTGAPVYPVSGSSGYGGDPPPPSSGEGGGPPWGGDDRDFNYYEEERYWTDYLRIAAPILGVIVLVILLWFWIANFLGDDDGDDDTAGQGTATEVNIPTEAATGAETAGENGSTASPPADATPPTQPPTGGPTATPGPGETEPEDGNGGVAIYLGATVEVVNTDGAGVNVRSEASTESEVLTVFLDGTQVEVIGGPFEAEDFVWWQITGNEVESGWIVDTYLAVVE